MALRTAGGSRHLLLNPDLITREALYRLMDQLLFPMMANRTFERVFSQKIGDTINIKRPYYALTHKRNDGTLQAGDFNPMIDRSLTMKIDQRFVGALTYGDKDMTLDIRDFGNRYLQPIAEQLAYRFNQAGADELAAKTYFTDGTPGDSIAVDDIQDVRAHAADVSIPSTGGSFAVMEPQDIAAISKDLQKNVYNPELVSTAIREHYYGRLAGYRIFESIHIPHYGVQDYDTSGTPTCSGPSVPDDSLEWSTVPTDGWGNAKGTVKKGQVLTFGTRGTLGSAATSGVHEMQLRSEPRKRTGRLKQFVVIEDGPISSGSGAANIKVSPALIPEGKTVNSPDGTSLSLNAFQNVDKDVADGTVLGFVGEDNKQYRQSFFFNRDAMEYVNIALDKPDGLIGSRVTDPETGVTISYTTDSEVMTMRTIRRLDVFFGVLAVYAYQSIRLIGAEAYK